MAYEMSDYFCMDIRSVVAKNIRALKEHHKLTNLQMVKRCGVSEGTINRAMSGQVSLTIDQLAKIAVGFQLLPWQLLVPDINVNQPPTIYNITESEKALYERLRLALKA